MAVDWREPPAALLARGPADLVIGADLLYEERNGAALAALLPRLLRPGGEVLIADPRRPHATTLLEPLRAAGAGLAAGAGVGTLWGLGILAGVLPGIGTAIAGGTLAALLSSAAAGAATAGLAGTLIGFGIPEDEAKYYDEQFRSGRVRGHGASGRPPIRSRNHPAEFRRARHGGDALNSARGRSGRYRDGARCH